MLATLDATPLLGARTGVGRYVASLVEALAALPGAPQLHVAAFSWRGERRPVRGARWRGHRAPARLLQFLWAHWDLPPAELVTGATDVFHGTNFVLPPLRRAGGVVTVHDLTFLRHADTVAPAVTRYRTLVPRSVARAAIVVTPSATVAEEVRAEYHIEAARVLTTPLGVDSRWLDAEPPSAEWRARRRLPAHYFLAVGTLEPRKNLPVLLAAHRALRKEDHVPPLVLAGPSGLGTAPDVDADVLAVGYVSDDDLVPLVAGATALVFPSRYEGFGLPVLEALACGVPAVVSDLPVLREVAGHHAAYVPVGDVDALASAMAAVVSDDSGIQGRAARRRHASAFTWQRCAEQTLAAYTQAVA